ncbi:TIGR00270 family protein [ANME-1 cluster archaeon ex4572_4]|nr:multiprotein bridging factor aMBF1 [Methanophagales archaeon]OYT66479.1 MAG: TIGR00270 family protein [ANME-1 cluster archaeon ex4572_4]
MTQCEICGAEIKGGRAGLCIKIGSSELRVCKSCARHGTVVETETWREKSGKDKKQQTAVVGAGKRAEAERRQDSRLYEKMEHDLDAEAELAEDYGQRIKKAREKAGLKQAAFAQKINEKQSLLRKIEREEVLPSEAVRRKIERSLNISLSE